jgi:tetratricopeptide (TPR) repeat protein
MSTQAAPDSPQSHIALAKYLEQNRDQQQAFLQYSRAVDLRPPETTMQKIFSPMLRILMSVNDKDDALKLAKKWAKEYNKLADCQYNYAWILSQCDEKKLPEAVALYKQALQLDPKLTGAHYNMAILLVRLNQNEDAVAELKQFLKLAPDDADAAQAKKLLAKLTGGSGAEAANGTANGTPDKGANDRGSGDQAQQATPTGDQAPKAGAQQAQTAKEEQQPQPAQQASDQSRTSEAAVPAGDKDQSTK